MVFDKWFDVRVCVAGGRHQTRPFDSATFSLRVHEGLQKDSASCDLHQYHFMATILSLSKCLCGRSKKNRGAKKGEKVGAIKDRSRSYGIVMASFVSPAQKSNYPTHLTLDLLPFLLAPDSISLTVFFYNHTYENIAVIAHCVIEKRKTIGARFTEGLIENNEKLPRFSLKRCFFYWPCLGGVETIKRPLLRCFSFLCKWPTQRATSLRLTCDQSRHVE